MNDCDMVQHLISFIEQKEREAMNANILYGKKSENVKKIIEELDKVFEDEN